MTNILYSFRRCPYAMRARMALHEAGIKYEHREILLRDKPSHMLELSPKGSVPVLSADGKVIDESLDIMRWALPEAHIDTQLVSVIDGPFKFHLDRYKYASRYDTTVKRGDVNLDHRAKAVESLHEIERQLGNKAFLMGETLSATDMAIFPFVRQFAAVQPEWWSAESRTARTRLWLSSCLNSDLFNAVMKKYPVWTPSA